MSRPRGDEIASQKRLTTALRAVLARSLPDEPLVLACSGGRDSMTLLELLVVGGYGERLRVLHCDHGVRPQSRAEGSFVIERARVLGIPARTIALQVQAGDRGPQDAYRQARLKAYEQAMGDWQARVLLTAHHARDRAETMLIRLLRGAGREGLAVLPDWGPFPGRDDMIIARPLVHSEEQDLRTWAQARGVTWMEDASNLSPMYLRNRLRLELEPVLDRLEPGWVRSMARSAEELWREPWRQVEGQSATSSAPWIFEREKFAALSPGRRRARIMQALAMTEEAGGIPGAARFYLLDEEQELQERAPIALAQRIELLILGAPPGAHDLGFERRLRVGERWARLICVNEERLPTCPRPVRAQLMVTQSLILPGLGVEVAPRSVSADVEIMNGAALADVLDRRRGRSLSERMRRAGIPCGLRSFWPVLVTGAGALLGGLDQTSDCVVFKRPQTPRVQGKTP